MIFLAIIGTAAIIVAAVLLLDRRIRQRSLITQGETRKREVAVRTSHPAIVTSAGSCACDYDIDELNDDDLAQPFADLATTLLELDAADGVIDGVIGSDPVIGIDPGAPEGDCTVYTPPDVTSAPSCPDPGYSTDSTYTSSSDSSSSYDSGSSSSSYDSGSSSSYDSGSSGGGDW